MRLRFTVHAETMLRERGIDRAWVEQVLAKPDWAEPDQSQDHVTLAFGSVPEAGGKVLRVVYSEAAGERRVITAFFDARRKRPK